MSETEVRFFRTPADFRRWLTKHHATARELWVGFYKTGSGKPSITWPESVDQALCFGWIDGIRKSIDEESYKIRFTPRKASSIWSAVNIRRVGALAGEGLMQPAGLEAFAARKANKSGIYSYEQRSAKLPEPYEARLRQDPAAWDFFQSQPASYRKAAMWWVVSAKKEETRAKRLATLIEDSAHGRTLAQFTRIKKTQ
jgi:uncharacterized protein YdeI (YjbR/CyaY-like superfamily)